MNRPDHGQSGFRVGAFPKHEIQFFDHHLPGFYFGGASPVNEAIQNGRMPDQDTGQKIAGTKQYGKEFYQLGIFFQQDQESGFGADAGHKVAQMQNGPVGIGRARRMGDHDREQPFDVGSVPRQTMRQVPHPPNVPEHGQSRIRPGETGFDFSTACSGFFAFVHAHPINCIEPSPAASSAWSCTLVRLLPVFQEIGEQLVVMARDCSACGLIQRVFQIPFQESPE